MTHNPKSLSLFSAAHRHKVSRRVFVAGVGGVALSMPFVRPSWAADKSLIVRDAGGPFATAYKAAFYDPFEKETGIKVTGVQASHGPTGEIKAMVDAGNYAWDGAFLGKQDVDVLARNNYVEPVGALGPNASQIPQIFQSEHLVGVGAYATALAYRSDTMGQKPPTSWADFWNVAEFPGVRSLRKHPGHSLEQALLADGVQSDQLYPLDLDRAFASLDKIRNDIAVWWTGGAQTSQLLNSGEVDCIPVWNGRAQVAIDEGAPVKLVWDGAILAFGGWAILRGGPKTEMMREFIEFCSIAEQQAIVPQHAADGPCNPGAYKFIAPERAAILPTNPEFLGKMFSADTDWWGENKDLAQERFETWILG